MLSYVGYSVELRMEIWVTICKSNNPKEVDLLFVNAFD